MKVTGLSACGEISSSVCSLLKFSVVLFHACGSVIKPVVGGPASCQIHVQVNTSYQQKEWFGSGLIS